MMIHVRHDGRSFDLNADRLDVASLATDAEIRAALARHLEVSRDALDELVVDRRPSGDIVVRPEAVYG